MLKPLDFLYLEHFKHEDRVMDVLFEKVDDLFLAGNFNVVDDFLAQTDVGLQSTQMLVSILCITFAAENKLKEREDFFNRAFLKLVERDGIEKTQKLLKGLR